MTFPAQFPDLLTSDGSMLAALTAAQAATAVVFPSAGVHLSAPISIAAVQNPTSSSVSFAYAGFRDTEMHYSGSLLKVAAMFAAFELRQSAADFAQNEGNCAAGVVFNDLKASFDQDIANSVPRLLTEPGITDAMRLPKYPTIFASPQGLASGGCAMSFSTAFANNIRGMIVPSDNNMASATIQALGYSWINGLLSQGGLFDQNTNTGIWLGGTFTGAFPAVRVPSVNDGPSAQATTTVDMTRVLALIVEANTLDSRTNADGIASDMKDLLAQGQNAADADSSWMTTGARAGIDGLGPGFTITHCKIGLGNLKAGGDVSSEGTILSHDDTGQQFLVVWQNVADNTDALNAITFEVRRTILNYLGLP